MALTVTSGLTEWDDCDTDNWTGDATVGNDTDFKIEGTGSTGFDVDIETLYVKGPDIASTDLSSNVIYFWFLSFSASTLDTKSAGGIQITAEDSSGNASYWYVGGSDTYSGGWEVFACSTAETPDGNNGTIATLTDITNIGCGVKNTAKSKLADNCFVDWVRYGTAAALTITGTNTVADDGWSEVLTGDTTGVFGIIRQQKGGYILKGPVQIGDSAGTATTDFTDTGTTLVFDSLPVGNSHYGITVAGNGTGTTDVQFGSVVGSGDDRQGVVGNAISTAGPSWFWDSDTDIADLDTVLLYGCTFTGAKEGVDLDDSTKTSVISSTFVNCGAVSTGTTSNGAEILNSFIIDPDGTTNNYGLQFDQTPSGGTMTTNVKQCNFITSGTPTTQYMVHFPYSGDYTVSFVDMQVFGSFTSGTLWHGINTGTDADVTVNSTGTTNFATAEFSSTDVVGDTGSVTVSASVPISWLVKDKTNTVIAGAQVSAYKLSDETEVLTPTDTNGSGIVSSTYSGTTPVDIRYRITKSSTGSQKYVDFNSSGTIESGTGLSVTSILREDDIADPSA